MANSNTLSVFNFKSTEVRTVVIDDNVWFIASDIAKALDYPQAKDMARILDDDERGRQIVPTPSGDLEMVVINESGLYHAVLKSRKPEAKPFRKWVTSEVLPTIRKTGKYEAAPYSVNPTDKLTKAQADVLRNMITRAAEELPKEKQAGFTIKAWSKLKAHFKAGYRDIPQGEFHEAVSLVARHIAEGELIPANKISDSLQDNIDHVARGVVLRQYESTRRLLMEEAIGQLAFGATDEQALQAVENMARRAGDMVIVGYQDIQELGEAVSEAINAAGYACAAIQRIEQRTGLTIHSPTLKHRGIDPSYTRLNKLVHEVVCRM